MNDWRASLALSLWIVFVVVLAIMTQPIPVMVGNVFGIWIGQAITHASTDES